ncbi:MAG: STAS domain-containing protein [Terriglobales bacterium]
METAIGVFNSREHAEAAVKELLASKVPEDSIVFLTRSEAEAETIGKQLGATVGGFVGGAAGMTSGVVVASLLLPGIGTLFALGLGAAALVGLAGAGAGAAVGKATAGENRGLQPTAGEKCAEDVSFFRAVLAEGKSLIVVRAESPELAQTACEILDRLGLGIQGRTPVKTQTSTREIEDVVIVDVVGRITLGEGNVMLRDVIAMLIDKGHAKILLNLQEVGYVDSSGVGELVRACTSVRNRGGQLKLVSPSNRVSDLLRLTRLHNVFDIEVDEASGVQSFNRPSSQAVA